ncbi:MAG: 16S rRNA (cytidine(1402)-2'-O)-methyltransferase, partial [Firmicutes bacterium]|nr:16S rRNA (cytidine(1402)-2'-O)-methyltransferase [Bacillota bacterium]
NGVPVTVVPGATAAVTALVLSGISSRSYVFEGFLPSNKHVRAEVIESLKRQTATIIIYEAPHHLQKTLSELAEALGDRPAAAVKELTKRHENVNRSTLSSLAEFYAKEPPKGEFVIIIEGIDHAELKNEKTEEASKIPIEEHFKMFVEKGMDEKSAMKAVAKERGIGKREVYDAVKLKDN